MENQKNPLWLCYSELPPDYFTERVLNFRVARHWRFFTIRRIHIDVMIAACTFESATIALKLTNEVLSFHTSTPSSFVCV